MAASISLPQARIPIGWAMVDGARIPVEIDMEWMLTLTRLFERSGGTSGGTSFNEYITQFFDAPGADPALQEAVRAVDDLRHELASSRSDVQTLRGLIEEQAETLAQTRTGDNWRSRVEELESLIEAGRPSPLPATTEQFIAPTLGNSWVNFGLQYNPAGYYKDPLGIVHLRGMIKSGVLDTGAFTLPAGYRPANTDLFSVISNNAVGWLEVTNAGVVNPRFGSNVWFSMDSITFRAA